MLLASIEILGGLGNHLFQIAFLLHYLKVSRQKDRYRKIVFKNEYDVGNKYQLERKTFWRSLFKDQFNIMDVYDYNNIRFDIIYGEGEHHKFQQLPYELEKNILFKGYFQSFKYIDDDIRKQMINYLYSNEDIMYNAYDKYNLIKMYFGDKTQDDDMISMHVRRTDYVWDSNYHNNLTLNYYKEALKIAKKQFIVIFSDDIEWCKNNITNNIYENAIIYFVDVRIVEIEFILMSMFQHNIIANSTFSLWASFISSYENKIVIAPQAWYSNNNNEMQDWSEIYHKYITHKI